MITRKSLLYSTFIGLPAEVANSSQRRMVGLKGIVIDETKNLIVIERGDGTSVKVPKNGATFRFTTEDGAAVEVEGRKIAFRPHERPKKV
jgi:ribonuclease P protein subunit POP4